MFKSEFEVFLICNVLLFKYCFNDKIMEKNHKIQNQKIEVETIGKRKQR